MMKRSGDDQAVQLAWQTALADAARLLPGTVTRPDIPDSWLTPEPESLASHFGIELVRIPCGRSVPDGVPVISTDSSGAPRLTTPRESGASPSSERWAVAPALSRPMIESAAMWLATHWFRRIVYALLTAAAAALLALFSFGLLVDRGDSLLGVPFLLLTSLGAFGFVFSIGWAGATIDRWGLTLDWFARTSVLAHVLRLPAADEPDSQSQTGTAAVAAQTLASGVSMITRPLTAFTSLLVVSIAVSLTLAPLLLIPSILVPFAVVSAVALLAQPTMRFSRGAQVAADRSQADLAAIIDARLLTRDETIEVDEIARNAMETIRMNTRARRVAAPVTATASLLPLGMVLLVTTLFWDAVPNDTSDAVVILAATGALGAACGRAAETILRALVTMAPVGLVTSLAYAHPHPIATNPHTCRNGAMLLQNVLVESSDGVSSPFSMTIDPGDRLQPFHPDPVVLTGIAESINGIRTPLEGRVVEPQQADGRASGEHRPRALIPRDPSLPSGNLETVLFGASDVDDSVRQTVLERTGLQSVVHAMPLGLATPLLDGGRWLDPETRLRILLARALARDSSPVVIDQALDELSESARIAIGHVLTSWPGTVVVTSRKETPIVPGFSLCELEAPGSNASSARGRVESTIDVRSR